MIINESAAKAMKFKDPIGQLIDDYGTIYHIVGVIKDFVLGSPYEPTQSHDHRRKQRKLFQYH